MVVALAYALLRVSPSLAAGSFSDDGVYLALGRALAEGEGYRSLYAAGAPAHAKYPPGVPFVLAGAWLLGGGLEAAHSIALALSLLVSALAAGLLWWVARRRLEVPPILAAVFVVGPFLLEVSVQYLNLPLSEPYFLVAWAGAAAAWPSASEGGITAVAVRRGVLLGALAAACGLFRTQGMVLIPALALSLALNRRWRPLLGFGVAATVPLAGWSVWRSLILSAGPSTTQPDEAGYVAWLPGGGLAGRLGTLRELITAQARGYWATLPEHFAGVRMVGAIILVAVIAVAVAGMAAARRKEADLLLGTVAVGGTAALWPFAQDRFAITLLPFLGLFAAVALDRFVLQRGRRIRAVAYAAFALATGVVAARQVTIRRSVLEGASAESFYFHPARFLLDNSRFIVSTSARLREAAESGERVLTPLPSGIFLYSGHPGVNATPAEPSVGPSVFDEPAAYLLGRVRDDSVTVLVLWKRDFPITRDAALLQRACAGALSYIGSADATPPASIFRIDLGDPCLRAKIREGRLDVTGLQPPAPG